MAKKKLQLSEIKVKSFVTQVDQSAQRTAKGGYSYTSKASAILIAIDSRPSWTELKTRTSGDSHSVRFSSLNKR